jgi:hypothetical protein
MQSIVAGCANRDRARGLGGPVQEEKSEALSHAGYRMADIGGRAREGLFGRPVAPAGVMWSGLAVRQREGEGAEEGSRRMRRGRLGMWVCG